MPRNSLGGKKITQYLREMSAETESLLDTGEVVDKASALAAMLWKKALGYSAIEEVRGVKVDVYHPPEAWAIQLVYERLEGKVPQAPTDESNKLSAADRVSELAKSRINGLLTPAQPEPTAAAGVPSRIKTPPPKLRPSKEKKNGNSSAAS